jgi:hypothetical protein
MDFLAARGPRLFNGTLLRARAWTERGDVPGYKGMHPRISKARIPQKTKGYVSAMLTQVEGAAGDI